LLIGKELDRQGASTTARALAEGDAGSQG
jgi:hypothetical protein